MTHQAKIKNVLVMLSPDLIKPDQPRESPLIQRAVALAKITGCELELFHVCYDSGLENQLFESDAELEQKREETINKDATLLADMATRLKNQSIKVRHEVRWDSPRSDAILRKIAQARPDVVMKQAREHSFVLGLTSNTDWDLVRRSPSHVWLVNEKVEDIERVLVAVGNKFGDPGDATTAADYDILRMADLVGNTFKGAVHTVNAYEVPEPQRLVAGVEGALAPIASADDQDRLRKKIVKKHSGSVKALAQYFHISKDNVHICEGQPSEVISSVAESIKSDMIVLGASSMGRLERLFNVVTVEPVIADTDTDILVVRERNFEYVPDIAKSPSSGVPKYDLEHAITNPESAFESPNDVANMPEISFELRNRILQVWEYDIRAEMADENEGGPVRDIDVNALNEIYTARDLLATNQKKRGCDERALHGVGG